MMRVLLDTNIVMDVLQSRQPFVQASEALIKLAESGLFTPLLCATTVTNIYYIGRKQYGNEHAVAQIKTLLEVFEIAPVTQTVLSRATTLMFSDYEDAVQHAAASAAGATAIATRDLKDYENATLSIYRPEELVRLLSVNP
jgi:predicted nucleic acid-binding protein